MNNRNSQHVNSFEDLNLRRPYLKRFIIKHFPPDRDSIILDLGCGSGSLIYFAQQTGYHKIQGVDLSPQKISNANKCGIHGVEQGDALETLNKKAADTFDCLIAFDLIEHFNRTNLLLFIDAAYRTLKPGGRWLIHTTNAESPFGMTIRYGDITHQLAFTRASLSQLLYLSGFSQVNCYEDQPVPHGIISAVRWLLWKIIRNGLRLYRAIETGDIGHHAIFSQNILVVAVK
ncbi:MAG: class I SAM-dependent methyltransferase [Deltaproteobacteria bacterium]|nr:class I SAM-dependent methyltransferase [Deltaproteobacteria bacterium]